MRNQLPLRYWNFAAWQNDTLPSTFVGWPVHLPVHLVMPAHSFCEKYSAKTPYSNHHRSARHKQSLALVGIPLMLTVVDLFLDGGSGPKDIWSKHITLTGRTKGQIPVDAP